jgi:hypothetical protein
MNIQAVGGDIADLAPDLAEAAVLWLRSGYNLRFTTWFCKILQRYPQERLCESPSRDREALKTPWISLRDRIIRLNPPDNKLKWLYIFSNPEDSMGVLSLEEVQSLIYRCFDALSRLECRSAAMIHIPFSPRNHNTSSQQDAASAEAMIEAIRTWDKNNPGKIDKVFLVDRKNDFIKQLEDAS